MDGDKRKAVVLLSGGLDSATSLAIARGSGFRAAAITFRYGQRHRVEVEAAQRVAKQQVVDKHVIVDIDLRRFGGSALTGNVDVPTDRTIAEMAASIPVTYVPARNTIFLSYALAWAEVLGAFDIFAGMNALDYGGYPDCRPAYVEAFENMANLATKASLEGRGRIRVHTPLISLNKAQIIDRGLSLGVDFGLTSSCYEPSVDGVACGHCDACVLRLQGFAENGINDPVKYHDREHAAI